MPNHRATSPEPLKNAAAQPSDATTPADTYGAPAPEVQPNPTWTEEQRSYIRRTDPAQESRFAVEPAVKPAVRSTAKPAIEPSLDPVEQQVTAMLISSTVVGAG